jgi:hypothetical protein
MEGLSIDNGSIKIQAFVWETTLRAAALTAMHDDHSILRDLGFWVAVAIGCSAILAGAGVI